MAVLFFGSGFAALIYQLAWFHLLRIIIGASAVSLAILLSTFMGGMCLGSLIFHRWAPAQQHPLKVLAWLEVGTGLTGLTACFALPLIGSFYQWYATWAYPGIAMRSVIAVICLLPPTILMGATLPAAARFVQGRPDGASRLGAIYGANLAGAVMGTLCAGFYLLRVHDVLIASCLAAAVNFATAAAAWYVAKRVSVRREPGVLGIRSDARVPGRLLAVTAISGMTALAAEVVWTRELAMFFGATVYTFTIILFIFLTGLGLGSAVAARWIGRGGSGAIGLAFCQVCLAATIPLAGGFIHEVVPGWKPWADSTPLPVWLKFSSDMARTAVAVLPSAMLWGASFPFVIAAAGLGRGDGGRQVGQLYAANTLGGIVGTLLVAFVILPRLGTSSAEPMMTWLTGLAGLWMILATRAPRAATRKGWYLPPLARWSAVAAVAILVLGSTGQIANVGTWTAEALALRRSGLGQNAMFYREGVSTTVMVQGAPDGSRSLWVSGKVEASSLPKDMRLQRMLGHVPALIHPEPKRVLVVGLGTGTTAGCFVEHPEVESITICELEPAMHTAAERFFPVENRRVLHDPRTRVIFDDARHFVATTHEKFDIITSDPIHPWVRGAAALYSWEYYETAKRRLNQGGIFVQWLPLYQTSEESARTALATFFKAFPDGTFWQNNAGDKGYDGLLLGQVGGSTVDLVRFVSRFDGNSAVRGSLQEVGIVSAFSLLRSYSAYGGDLADWLRSATINHDLSLRLEYLAGLSAEQERAHDIFLAIALHRRFPERLFVAPPQLQDELRRQF